MATEVRFITSIMVGIMKAMARLVNSWVSRSLREAASKRFSSKPSRLKARTTDRPFSISRATRFTRSMSVCMILNRGSVKRNRTAMTAKTMATASTTIHPNWGLVTMTMTTPPMAEDGA